MFTISGAKKRLTMLKLYYCKIGLGALHGKMFLLRRRGGGWVGGG